MSPRNVASAGIAFLLALTLGCEESTSGADREAKRSRFSTGGSQAASGGTGGSATGTSGGTAGTGCGSVTEVGSCNGNVITFCDDGELVTGDCRMVDPSCVCGFDDDVDVYDCLCAGSSGAGGGAGTGGGVAGTGSGGSSTPGGSGGTGTMCLNPGQGCGDEGETCCTDNLCVSFDDASPVCAASCVLSSGCSSDCCALLASYAGACGPSTACGGSGCRVRGAPCDSVADCCVQDTPTVCADPDRGGPKVCTASCTQNADCADFCCRTDSHGVRGCFPAELCQ